MADGKEGAGGEESTAVRVPWLGFEIERRTDFLALAAFSIAMITAGYQLIGFVRGFDVVIFQPEQVAIVFEDYGGEESFVRIHARMAYVNRGQPGYNAAIAKEVVSFELGGRPYEQVWQDFQDFASENGELIKSEKKAARPTPIAAGSAISHETYFAAHPNRCDPTAAACDKWANLSSAGDFIAALDGTSELTFLFRAELYGGSPVDVACTIDVDSDLFGNLAIRGWAAPLCRPE